jgi:hypothetical protein
MYQVSKTVHPPSRFSLGFPFHKQQIVCIHFKKSTLLSTCKRNYQLGEKFRLLTFQLLHLIVVSSLFVLYFPESSHSDPVCVTFRVIYSTNTRNVYRNCSLNPGYIFLGRKISPFSFGIAYFVGRMTSCSWNSCTETGRDRQQQHLEQEQIGAEKANIHYPETIAPSTARKISRYHFC